MEEEEFLKFAKWGTGAVDDGGPVEVTPPPEDEVEDVVDEPEVTEPVVEEPKPKYPFKGFLRRGYTALRLRSRPTTHEKNAVGAIKRGYSFSVYKEHQLGDDIWWLIELPDGTVGWGARRYNGISYLEPDN